MTVDQVMEFIIAVTEKILYDIDDIDFFYLNDRGIFYIALDNNMVIGSSAIKKIDDEVCELKRMYFLKEYRGQVLGTMMAEKLFAFAKSNGYKKIGLDVYHAEAQKHAIRFYQKLGFYEIPAYKRSTA